MHGMKPIERLTFEAAALMAEHPPRMRHPNKQAVLDIACPPGDPIEGTIHYSRWSALPLPARFTRPAPGSIVAVPGWYAYEPPADDEADGRTFVWHVNFADAHLFGYYAGRHFAQDEAQVAEHPVLASVREALLARGLPAVTEQGGRATPVLVRGAERRVAIAVDTSREAGVEGLYGKRFRAASSEFVASRTRRLTPSTITNVLAIAAPSYGTGPYELAAIEEILTTAYTGFRAAVTESVEGAGASRTRIHTGYWGCGAFGGDRELLSLLQVLAATAAGVDRLDYWTGSNDGAEPYERAMETLMAIVPADGIATAALVAAVLDRGYRWGRSDGT